MIPTRPPSASTLPLAGKGLIWRASLLGAGLLVLVHAHASALTAYVSNEKSNSQRHRYRQAYGGKDHQGRPETARHRIEQGWKVHPGRGRGRRYHPDDRQQYARDRGHIAV